MERVLSPEDRLRKAEEIYYRRNSINGDKFKEINFTSKKGYKLLKKLGIQSIICIGIYYGLYGMQTKTDNISVNSIKYIKNMLTYDMDLKKYIENGQKYLSSFYNKNDNSKIEEEPKEQTEETPVSDSEEVQEEETKEEDIANESTENLTKMEQDAKYIKENFSFIKPTEGEISSRFGPRNPTTQTVPKYHTGIDIAVSEGTKFVAAMEGTVTQVSNEGDYRKSC